MTPRPPPLARRLLSLAFPPEDREAVLVDLDEEYREHRLGRGGVPGARRWYWSQALRSVPHGLLLRLDGPSGDLLKGLAGDLRFAARTLRVRPGFAATVVVPLGAGIGVCVLAWGVVEGAVLNPFPYPEPDRLVAVVVEDRRSGGPTDFMENVSPPEFLDLRRESATLEHLYAFDRTRGHLETPAGVLSVPLTLGWGDPFALLGVRPWLGRGFRPDEMEPAGAPVMVLGHGLWVEAFGADSSVVGRALELSGVSRTVVGVMQPGIAFAGADVWRPGGSPPARRSRGPRRLFQIAARIAPGYGLDEVNRELADISRRMETRHAADHPEYRHRTFRAVTWTEASVRDYGPLAFFLLGVTALLLLLIAVNAANLVLARSVRRGRELAIRAALGAGKLRLVRQLLTEGLILALSGGALGVVTGAAALRGAGTLLDLVPGIHGDVGAGWQVVPAALLLSLVAGVVVSLVPALHVARRDVRSFLGTEGPGATPSRPLRRKQHLLLGIQTAMTVLVLTAGTVLVRAFLDVVRADVGFDTSSLLTLFVDLPGTYGPEEAATFWVELQRRVDELPGVRSAGVSTGLHPVDVWRRPVALDGEEALASVRIVYATPAYLETLGVRWLQGSHEELASNGPAATAVVNRAFARRHGGGASVIGRTVRDVQEELGREYRIVGVVEDVRNAGLSVPAEPEVLLNRRHTVTYKNAMHLVARTDPPPLQLLPPIRAVIRALDPSLPVRDAATLEAVMARRSAPLRVGTWTLVTLSVTALLLAAAGVGGLVAFTAAHRRREIGIRRALGARGVVLRRAMAGGTLRPALTGLAVGSGAALVAGSLGGDRLPAPAEADPVLVVPALLAVGTVAALAAWIPAVHASRGDPSEVLRAE